MRWLRQFWYFTLSAPGREILIVVTTQTLPGHYFGAFRLTEENYAPNESTAQTISPISFDLQLLSIVFAWWHRQFWHFHLVGTGPWNFNCCQNTNFAGPLFWCFSSYRRELCTKWISSSNCIINKLWFTSTFIFFFFFWWWLISSTELRNFNK